MRFLLPALADRRFNRARYDAEQIIAAFARQIREHADIDTGRTSAFT